MPYEQRDNSGTLGKNKRRQQDSHPEYSGQITVAGVDYWLSAWVKSNKETGEKFFSLSVKPKESRGGGQSRQQNTTSRRDEAPPSDDVPF